MNEVGEFGTGLVVGWLTAGVGVAAIMGTAMWLAGWPERHAVYRPPRRPVVQLAPWLWGEPLDVAPRSSVAASDYGFLVPPFETPLYDEWRRAQPPYPGIQHDWSEVVPLSPVAWDLKPNYQTRPIAAVMKDGELVWSFDDELPKARNVGDWSTEGDATWEPPVSERFQVEGMDTSLR